VSVTRSDLRELKRIQRLQPTAGLAAFLRHAEERRRERPPATTPQLLLALVTVECRPLHSTITLAACIARQSAAIPHGGGKGHAVHEPCGKCPLRETHREMAGRFTAPRYQPKAPITRLRAEVRARRKAYAVGLLDEPPTIDDPIADELGGRD
jgi:hypothetical protein